MKEDFRRAVLVNVIANLIAAAIIYLFTIMAGALKANPQLTTLAVMILGGFSGFALANIKWKTERSFTLGRLASKILMTIAGLIACSFTAISAWKAEGDPTEIFFSLTGVISIAAAARVYYVVLSDPPNYPNNEKTVD